MRRLVFDKITNSVTVSLKEPYTIVKRKKNHEDYIVNIVEHISWNFVVWIVIIILRERNTISSPLGVYRSVSVFINILFKSKICNRFSIFSRDPVGWSISSFYRFVNGGLHKVIKCFSTSNYFVSKKLMLYNVPLNLHGVLNKHQFMSAWFVWLIKQKVTEMNTKKIGSAKSMVDRASIWTRNHAEGPMIKYKNLRETK